MWVDIPGYKFHYRINDDGIVQKLDGDEWKTLAYNINTRAEVTFRTVDGKRKKIPVVRLMAIAFMGGYKRGMAVIHKNRVKTDNALHNLKIVTKSQAAAMADSPKRRPVEMVDRDGNVIEVYRSQNAAGKANYLSKSAVSERCRNKYKDPYSLTGYTFRYEESGKGRPKK